MILKTAIQLKALANNLARKNHEEPLAIMANYMYERIIARISLSRYRDNFIIKGGFLLTSIIGINERLTMDLDSTLVGLPRSHEEATRIMNEIIHIDAHDNVTFKMVSTEDILIWNAFPGLRLHIDAKLDKTLIHLSIDLTFDDGGTIESTSYQYPSVFGNDYIDVMSYKIEMILVEKISAILQRGEATTRLRDYYDVYILYNRRMGNVSLRLLGDLLIKTLYKRGLSDNLKNYKAILKSCRESPTLNQQWVKYQSAYKYALGINLSDICDIVEKLITTSLKVANKHDV